MLSCTLWVACMVAIATTPAAAAHISEVIVTEATLFGGLDTACVPNATVACDPSVVDAVAFVRSLKASGVPHAFLPALDRFHILSKMHPMDWGANFALHRQLGVARALLTSYVLAYSEGATVAQYSVREGDPRLVESFDFPVSHNMRSIVTSRIVDAATGLHIIVARLRFEQLRDRAAIAALTMAQSDTFRAQQGGYKNTMVITSDATPEDFAAALAEHGQRAEIICRVYARSSSVEFKNGTWLVNFRPSRTHLHRIAIHRLSNTSSTIVNVTLTAQPLELPPAMRTDPQYVADRAMMKAQALIAAANNPVQGRTAGPMPSPIGVDGEALCRRGECPMGNLWADAIRNATGTDVALFTGPWLEGPGWAAGNVTLRDLLLSYAFIEMTAKVTVLGLSLFELWNESISLHAFDPFMPTSQTGGRHLPQVSGMRVTYNLARANVNDRLVSLEVWDRTANEYRPLERLKLYTVSGPMFLMQNSRVHGKHLKPRYEGEVPLSPVGQDIQALCRMSVKAGTYVPGIFGRLVEDNASDVSMSSWNERAKGCAANYVLDDAINTCVACPADHHRPTGVTSCVPIPVEEPLLSATAIVVVVAAVVVAALVALAASVAAFFRWQRFKRTRYCPRDGSQPIAAFFITVRNELVIREQYPGTADAVFKRIEAIVSDAANDNQCFVARRLGAHFLVVGSDPVSAVRASCHARAAIHGAAWHSLLPPDSFAKSRRVTHWLPRRRTSDPTRAESHHLDGRGSPAMTSVVPTTSTWSPDPCSDTPNSPGELNKSECAVPRCGHSITAPTVPLVSAGMTWGTAKVNHDDEVDTWVYSGLAVDAAAAVADAARPGQFLATDALCEAAAKDAVGAVFSDFATRRMTCPLSQVEKAVQLVQVDCATSPRCQFEEIPSDESEASVGALAAALEVAAGGLTIRTVGAVCWSVPTLRTPKAFETRLEQAKAMEVVFRALRAACEEFHADLACAVDGSFVAVVNGAVARTAQVATMTTALARAGVANVMEVSPLSIVAGAATGPAMAGSLDSNLVVSGVAAERARLLATLGNSYTDGPLPIADHGVINVVVPHDMAADLEPHYVLAAVDAIAWPDHCVARSAQPRSPVCVYAVVAEKDVDEEEWLYQLEAAASHNPYGKGNAVLRGVIDGAACGVDLPSLQHPEELDGVTMYPRIRIAPLLLALHEVMAGPCSNPAVLIMAVLQERLRSVCCAFSSAAVPHDSLPVAWTSP